MSPPGGARVSMRSLTFACGACRKDGTWDGNLPVGANVATYPPPAGWAFLPKFIRSKETGIVVALQIPVCSEACAKIVVAAQAQNVPEVVEVMKAVAEGQTTAVSKPTSLTTAPTLPPRGK